MAQKTKKSTKPSSPKRTTKTFETLLADAMKEHSFVHVKEVTDKSGKAKPKYSTASLTGYKRFWEQPKSTSPRVGGKSRPSSYNPNFVYTKNGTIAGDYTVLARWFPRDVSDAISFWRIDNKDTYDFLNAVAGIESLRQSVSSDFLELDDIIKMSTLIAPTEAKKSPAKKASSPRGEGPAAKFREFYDRVKKEGKFLNVGGLNDKGVGAKSTARDKLPKAENMKMIDDVMFYITSRNEADHVNGARVAQMLLGQKVATPRLEAIRPPSRGASPAARMPGVMPSVMPTAGPFSQVPSNLPRPASPGRAGLPALPTRAPSPSRVGLPSLPALGGIGGAPTQSFVAPRPGGLPALGGMPTIPKFQ